MTDKPGSLRTCYAITLVGCLLVSGSAQAGPISSASGDGFSKLHPALLNRLDETEGPVKAWVFFTDKGINSPEEYDAAIQRVASTYNSRAIQRRMLRSDIFARSGAVFGEFDLPVVQAYIDAVEATGAREHVTSRWGNAISVWATRGQLERIAELAFVKKLQPVARARRIDVRNITESGDGPFPHRGSDGSRGLDYGASAAQLTQINLLALHEEGYTGSGVIVGILDTGFKRTHEAFNYPGHEVDIIAEYDFVDDDPVAAPEMGDPSDQHSHGTMILGCLGAYMPGDLVGGAYDASFVLAKTEDTTDEYPAEEDNFVAGLQFIEANGADMETSSLGYLDWYTQDDMDGMTAVTTIAVNISTSLGIHHCNAAGNEYHDSDPGTSHLIAPSDGFQVLTCGAVNSSGSIAYFSSDGPTADGRVKPEVLARGVSTHTVSATYDDSYTTADGTSLSTPLVACAVACLVDARPYWTVDQMRENLFETADYFVEYGTFDPLYIRGYGVIDAFTAYSVCVDAGTIVLNRPKYQCEDTVEIEVIDCGPDVDHEAIDSITVTITSDAEPAGETAVLYETDVASAQFQGSINVSGADAAGVVWVAAVDTITATYIDADDGAGGYDVPVVATAVADCQAPVISDVQATDIEPGSALVLFSTDEPAIGTVRYGLACDALTEAVTETEFVTSHVLSLAGLEHDIAYYFLVEAEDDLGNVGTDNNGGGCYTFTTPVVLIADDFETDQGWTVEDIDVEDGSWERSVPIGGGERGDPPTDFDGTGQCYLTANRIGNSDVDGGPTRLISPTFDPTGVADPVIAYARWWTNDDQDEDRMEVEISNDDGQSWVLIESVPNTVGWVERMIFIGAYLTPTAQMKIRFGATDSPNNSIDEGGIDAVLVWGWSDTALLGDYDGDGVVDLADFAHFQDCMTGPDAGPVMQECEVFSFDADSDVDLRDFAGFQATLAEF